MNSGAWFVGVVGLFVQGGLLKNLRLAVAGDHALSDDLVDSCEFDRDGVRDKAASLCFSFKVVGGIIQTKEKRGRVCHDAYIILIRLVTVNILLVERCSEPTYDSEHLSLARMVLRASKTNSCA